MNQAPLSPIECLPVELLIDMFMESEDPEIDKDSGDEELFYGTVGIDDFQRPVHSWVSLMLVCRRFHDVILAAPTMWFRIPVTDNLDAIRHRLVRSGQHPIDLLLRGPCKPALSLILPHASRIRSIVTVPRFCPREMRFLVPLFDAALPALEHVHIAPKLFTGDSNDWVLGLWRVDSPLLTEALHPRVRTLTSHRALLPPPRSAFWSSQLLHLDIRFHQESVTEERVNNVLDVLKATPLLESLAIVFPHEPRLHPSTNIDRPSSLMTRLREIRLFGPVWLTRAVLLTVDMPSLDRLYVNATAVETQIGDSATIVGLLPSRLRRVLSGHTRLHIHAASGGRGYYLGDCHCDTGRVSSVRFCVGIHSDVAIELSQPFGVLCRLFSEAPLEMLEVGYYAKLLPMATNPWQHVMETFPTLQKLALPRNSEKARASMVQDIEALQRLGLNKTVRVLEAEDEDEKEGVRSD